MNTLAMKAFTLDGFDTQPALRDDLPQPTPGERELLVRVGASSVDRSIAAGMLKGMVGYEFPVILGPLRRRGRADRRERDPLRVGR